jgi:hypothetical protein
MSSIARMGPMMVNEKARQARSRGCTRIERTIYLAMQMFFGSVKKGSASSPPSRPTPLALTPPKSLV